MPFTCLSKQRPRPHRFAALLLSLLCPHPAGAGIVETDVCVYGGAAGGVTAAVQARRMGKTVSLLVFNNHLGGLSSGGLGETDIGSHGDSYIQGIAREFYTRVGSKYGETAAKFRFEPKIAEQVFNEMASQAGVSIHFNQRLATTTMDGGRIREITMDNGTIFRAKMFIDASYEGDLMKQAGVSYTAGREANSQYGETINGIQTKTSGNQLPDGIDPYVVKGDPSSGLLPGVNPDPGGPDGSADSLIQAFCYRMCLTNVAANRVMIGQPEGYDEKDYEILFRAIEAGQTNRFWKLSPMPNGKTDSNNDSGISCDYITGKTGDYIEADYATREQIARDHEKWQRGLVWTVQNHPRVPKTIRDAWSQWGLPKDEFVDTGHWPHQLYVREARRMISDYVMTEKDCMGTVVASDPVTLGAYVMDSHNTQRIVRNGMVKNEGDVQRNVPGPYPISYRSIVPKTGECRNLLVPWSLSATHIAFGSIRMEPVFMNLGQVAATAACFAIDDAVDVQQVPYPKLRAQILADKQRISMSDPSATGVIIDNTDASGFEATGNWLASSSISGYQGSNYLHDSDTRNGSCSARFTPEFPATSDYQVFLRWAASTNRATNVPARVHHAQGVTDITPKINQRLNGGQWNLVGTFRFAAGSSIEHGSVMISNTGTDGYVIADAVRFVDLNERPSVSLWATDALALEPGSAFDAAASFTIARSGPATQPLTVRLAYSGSAQPGADCTELPQTVTFATGETSRTIPLAALGDDRSEGSESLILNVAEDPAYTVAALKQAQITIVDSAYDTWKSSHFTPAELATPAISGALADADGDGRSNLLECFAGSNPRTADTAPTLRLATEHGFSLIALRNPAADTLGMRIEDSSNLVDWQPSILAENSPDMSDRPPYQELLFRLGSPSPIGNRFFRLAVSASPDGF